MGLWGLQLLLTTQAQPVMQPIPVLESPRYYKTIQNKVVLLSRQRECSSRDLAPYLTDGACYLPFSDIPGVHLGPVTGPWLRLAARACLIPAPAQHCWLVLFKYLHCPLQDHFVLSNLPVTASVGSAVLGTASRAASVGFTLFYLRNGSPWITDMGFEWHCMDLVLAGLGNYTSQKWKGPKGIRTVDKWHFLMAAAILKEGQLHSCVSIRTAEKWGPVHSWSSMKEG